MCKRNILRRKQRTGARLKNGLKKAKKIASEITSILTSLQLAPNDIATLARFFVACLQANRHGHLRGYCAKIAYSCGLQAKLQASWLLLLRPDNVGLGRLRAMARSATAAKSARSAVGQKPASSVPEDRPQRRASCRRAACHIRHPTRRWFARRCHRQYWPPPSRDRR